ncbi:hypothetical protein CUMW_238640, partial [Citrus unshiu]
MAKSESSEIKVGMMYFRYADHFSGRISSMCNLSSVVKAIEEKLTKRQLNLFKKDIFGHFLECRNFSFSGVILHNLLLRQVAHEEDSREDQLCFQIGEHLFRLSIVEWRLVTGLSYGVDTKLRNNKTVHRLRNTYFGGVHRKINLKEFDALFKKLKFEAMDDIDALKIALFYFADRVLNARKNHCQINFSWLNEVDDIEYFRKRLWGLLSWKMIYKSLDNALFEKNEKFKTTRLKNPYHNIEKYNLYGFTSVVQHQPSINAMPSVTRQSDEHGDIPNPTPEQRHDTSEDEGAVDDHQEQTDNSDDAHDSEDSSLYAEFDRWFVGDMTVDQRVQHPRSFFEIILGIASMGWLSDEVFLNQLWNNGDCTVDSLVFDDRLNCYLCGRQHTMSKSMTDVNMLLIPVNLDGVHWVLARVDFRKNKVWIYDSLLTFRDDKKYKLKFKPLEVIFPRWLEYVGFYNIRLELRSANSWKVIAVKSVPQQEPGTGDC